MRRVGNDPRRDRRRSGVLRLLCLVFGAAWTLPAAAREAGTDVERLLPPAPEPPPAPPSPRPPDAGLLPPAAAAAPEAVRELDLELDYKLERIRFENFSPPPPGGAPASAGADSAASRLRRIRPPGLVPPQDARAPLPEPPPGVENEVSALAQALADPVSPLAEAVADALAKPFTLRKLKALEKAAETAARADGGWSLAQAYAPEQELTGGTLAIVVAPIWLEGVEVAPGARWSNPKALTRPYAGLVGDPVQMRALDRSYAEISRHPFRTITPTLKPGSVAGSSKLELAPHEQKPWTVFSGYETTHSRTSGAGRLNAGFTMAAPWRREDIWTAQYAADSEFRHLDSVSTVYRAALAGGRSLTATGLWSRTLSPPEAVFGQDAADWMVRLAYGVPLPTVRGWTHDAEFGLEWRRTATTSKFFGQAVDDYAVAAMPAQAGWSGQRLDRLGAWRLSADLAAGFDWGLAHMSREAYDRARAEASPNWLALRARATRDWTLPADFRLRQRAWGQWSPNRLIDAGRFNLGGGHSIRGYRESEVSGDGGFAFSTELFSPSLVRPPAPAPPGDAPGDAGSAAGGDAAGGVAEDAWRRWRPADLRLAAFYDAGLAYQSGSADARALAGERPTTTLMGAGLGLRFRYRPWLSVSFDYAWRLRDTGAFADDLVRGYGYLTVDASF